MNAHIHPASRPSGPGRSDLSATLASLSLQPVSQPSHAARRDRPRRRALAGAVLLLAGFGATAALVGTDADPLARLRSIGQGFTEAPDRTAATGAVPDTAPAAPAMPARRLVTGSGHVVALSEAEVHPRRGGTIVELAADIGDAVEAGQMLLRLDDPDLRFALRSAELARGRADLALAARRLDVREADALERRMAALSGSGAVNGQTARDAETAHRRAVNLEGQAAQDLAEADLAVSVARQAVADLSIRAPIAGLVTARGARLGEAILAQVDARGEASLFTITDPARLAIDIDIAETAVAAVRPGLVGEAVADADPDHPFRVAVRRIAPVASAERGTIALRLAILDPPTGLRPAMAVRVSLSPDAPPADGTTASNTEER